MKALVKYAPGSGNVDVLDVDEPLCPDDRVKIEVAFCGICGTDLHVLHDTFRNYPPVILGHEFAGRVVEIGRSVTGTFRIGDAVAGLGATAVRCGQCAFCLSGDFMFCAQRRGMGHGVNGAFTRYVVMRPDQLFVLPQWISLEEGALVEPFAALVHAVTEISPVRVGHRVLVSGPGPIGLLCVKLMVSAGIPTLVAGTATDVARLQAAERFGAVRAVNVDESSLADAVAAFTHGAGVDATFDCAGRPASIRACLESLRPLGHHTQVGVCGRSIDFPMDLLFSKELTVAGSLCYTEATWRRTMQVLATGGIQLADLVSHKLPLTDWRAAFELCERRESLKVLLYPV